MSKTKYDPSAVGLKGALFGYPYTLGESELVVLGVPWDVTTSYTDGTSNAPQQVVDASAQLDLSVYGVIKPWRFKACYESLNVDDLDPTGLRKQAKSHIDLLESGQEGDSGVTSAINSASEELNERIYQRAKEIIANDQFCVSLGGDHSTPYGLIKALSEVEEFGILQVDAHMDLRNAYEGFKYSHASIMYNALQLDGVNSLTQVGIRDYCEEETQFAKNSIKQVHTFHDDHVKSGMMIGDSWSDWVHNIVDYLPRSVYISFDIDGLDPSLCPSTGTPVPGGLSFEQAIYLLESVARSGRKIVGFDLSEVGAGSTDWDANVGARILYRLITCLGISQGRIKSTL